MVPPTWGDQETEPCPQCGAESPVTRTVEARWLKAYGWALFDVARIQPWCGHGRDYVLLPDRGGLVRLVPVLGEAA
jgi:hypothetical protein